MTGISKLKPFVTVLVLFFTGLFLNNAYAWHIPSSQLANSFSVGLQDGNPRDVEFSTNGTKMFIVGDDGNDINEYSLSTAFDVSTASYVGNFSVVSQDFYPHGLAFNNDGTKMYVGGRWREKVFQYSLGTAWDISTASYDNKYVLISGGDVSTHGIDFNNDGTKMYVVRWANRDVREYNLSTPFDVSTASFFQGKSISSGGWSPTGLVFNADGTRMFVLDSSTDYVNEYMLSNAFDISTAYFITSWSVSEDTNAMGITFNPSDDKMFIVGYTTDKVYAYDVLGNVIVPKSEFPRVLQISRSAETGNAIAHNVVIPSGLTVGNTLIAFFGADNGFDDVQVSWPSGWTELYDINAESVPYADMSAAWRKIDGTEGSSVTVTTNLTGVSSHVVFEISEARDPVVNPPESNTKTHSTCTDANPNPPNLSPSGGSDKYLWIAVESLRGIGSYNITSYPTNYSDNKNDIYMPYFSRIGTVTRQYESSSQNPGTFTNQNGYCWSAATIAVYPSSGTRRVMFVN